MTNPRCAHGLETWRRCEICELDILMGKSTGFTQPSSNEQLQDGWTPRPCCCANKGSNFMAHFLKAHIREGNWTPMFAAAADEIERLSGIVPELPPREPDGEGLPRYGIRWNGPTSPLAVPMNDGYWTPWHLAARASNEPPAVIDEQTEDEYVIDRLGGLLAEIAVALKGEQPAGTLWSYHDLPDMVRKLAAERTSQPPVVTQWQPIENAPKDGSRILLAKIVGHIDHPTAIWWVLQGNWSLKWNKWWDGVEPCGLAGPTHWMPVPRQLASAKPARFCGACSLAEFGGPTCACSAVETPAPLLCPNCESGEVGTFTCDNWFLYGVEKQYRLVAKDVLFFRCMACSLEYTGEDGEQKRDQAVRDHLARLAQSEGAHLQEKT